MYLLAVVALVLGPGYLVLGNGSAWDLALGSVWTAAGVLDLAMARVLRRRWARRQRAGGPDVAS